MTTKEFESLKFGAGMKISHTCPMTKTTTVFDVLAANFAERLFGVKDDRPEYCEHCGKIIDETKWLNYENCQILDN